MAILTGWGLPDFLVNGYLLDVEPMEISVDASSDTKKAKKFVGGKLVTAGTATGEETYVLKLGIEAIKWQDIQFALGQLSTVASTLSLPERKEATVPLTTPYEITDADITDTSVWVTLRDKGAWGLPKPLTKVITTPSTGQFQVDAENNKLIFPAAYAGARILYRVFVEQTAIDAIGVSATPTLLNELSFSGVTYGDTETGQFKFYIPKATRSSAPSINPSDVTKLEIEYELVPTTSNPLPFITVPISA
jgi:hypothetical protein